MTQLGLWRASWAVLVLGLFAPPTRRSSLNLLTARRDIPLVTASTTPLGEPSSDMPH
jgi:hypothetical protein